MGKIVGFLAALYLTFSFGGCANRYYVLARGGEVYQCKDQFLSEDNRKLVYTRTCYGRTGFVGDKEVFAQKPSFVERFKINNQYSNNQDLEEILRK